MYVARMLLWPVLMFTFFCLVVGANGMQMGPKFTAVSVVKKQGA